MAVAPKTKKKKQLNTSSTALQPPAPSLRGPPVPLVRSKFRNHCSTVVLPAIHLTQLPVDQATRSWTVSPTLAVHKYSPWRLVAWVNYILYGCAYHFSTITAGSSPYTQKCQFTRTERKASDSGEVKRSLKNCGSSVRNSLHVTLLTPRIYNSSTFFNNLWTLYLYISFT